jgi:hypothetical protein
MRLLILTLWLLACASCATMDDPSCDIECQNQADYFDCMYEGGTWNGMYCHTVDIGVYLN